jgi:hypothetical protein
MSHIITAGCHLSAAPSYTACESAPITLQAHADPSEPISVRNIWVREL